MSTSDIIAAISTTIAAASLTLTFLQYRVSKIRKRTETSRKADQSQHLFQLAHSATSQAETAKMIADRAARGVPVDIEDLRALADSSSVLAVELYTEAQRAAPEVPARI